MNYFSGLININNLQMSHFCVMYIGQRVTERNTEKHVMMPFALKLEIQNNLQNVSCVLLQISNQDIVTFDLY